MPEAGLGVIGTLIYQVKGSGSGVWMPYVRFILILIITIIILSFWINRIIYFTCFLELLFSVCKILSLWGQADDWWDWGRDLVGCLSCPSMRMMVWLKTDTQLGSGCHSRGSGLAYSISWHAWVFAIREPAGWLTGVLEWLGADLAPFRAQSFWEKAVRLLHIK